MEFKDLINLFRKEALLFWGIVFLCVVLGFLWQKAQPVAYQATELINIGRTGTETQATSEYTYDSFYRLQADERFADTVVRWLRSPRVVEDIYTESSLSPETLSLSKLKSAFTAGRLSSQMIEVSYGGPNEKVLTELSQAMSTVLNRYTVSLNREHPEPNWFVVIGSDPVIRDARVPLPLVLGIGVAVGLFIAFWSVLLKHYFQPTKNNKQ